MAYSQAGQPHPFSLTDTVHCACLVGLLVVVGGLVQSWIIVLCLVADTHTQRCDRPERLPAHLGLLFSSPGGSFDWKSSSCDCAIVMMQPAAVLFDICGSPC